MTAASVKALAIAILRSIENLQLPAAPNQALIDSTHKNITTAVDQLTSMIPLLPTSTDGFTPVESSNLAGVRWDEDSLFVQFKNGGVYQYHDVPKSEFDELIESNSKGQFLNSRIKPNYQFTKH